MTTATLTGLFDRVGPELAALLRRAIKLGMGGSPPRSATLPPLTRIHAPSAPQEWPGRLDARVHGSSYLWIGGEPEPPQVIGAGPHG
jgi:hypothetical protein